MNNLPKIPEDNFTQKREIIIDSYSETISSESTSEDRSVTAEKENTTSSMEDHFEDSSCRKENNVTKIEALLHQIATSLHSAAKGYMSLASCIHKIEPYEIPQVVAQIPPLPIECLLEKLELLMVKIKL